MVFAAGCDERPAGPSAAPTGEGFGHAASTGSTSATATPGPTAPATRAPGSPRTRRYVFPVQTRNVDYHPTHSVYPGTDIFADCGSPVVAVTDGTVLEVSRIDRFDSRGPLGPYNGGLSVSLLGDDGVRYYGSHLTEVSTGIEAGVRVQAGQRVGSVGRTGNANNVCHLHFGISPPCRQIGDWWIRRGVVWPAPFLDSWKRKANRSPVDKVTAWQQAHGCPKAP
ncbi:MAG TPA: M23 family metallopeptidase [Micromonospora sp.]